MDKETFFYERLEEQLRLKHKSFNQIERELGYPRNTLHNYKRGVFLQRNDYLNLPIILKLIQSTFLAKKR